MDVDDFLERAEDACLFSFIISFIVNDEAEEEEEPEEEKEEVIQRDSIYVFYFFYSMSNSHLRNILILFYVVLLTLQIMNKY